MVVSASNSPWRGRFPGSPDGSPQLKSMPQGQLKRLLFLQFPPLGLLFLLPAKIEWPRKRIFKEGRVLYLHTRSLMKRLLSVGLEEQFGGETASAEAELTKFAARLLLLPLSLTLLPSLFTAIVVVAAAAVGCVWRAAPLLLHASAASSREGQFPKVRLSKEERKRSLCVSSLRPQNCSVIARRRKTT